MTKRFSLPTLLAACIVSVAGFSMIAARDTAPPDFKALELHYAQANLNLSKARLAMAQAQNAQIGGTIPKEMLDALASGVQMTQDRLRLLESGQNAPFAPQIVAAQGIIQALAANHNESLKANQLQPGAVPNFALAREQAEIEVAKARLATLQALAQQSPEVRIEWELSLIHDDIAALWARPLIQD